VQSSSPERLSAGDFLHQTRPSRRFDQKLRQGLQRGQRACFNSGNILTSLCIRLCYRPSSASARMEGTRALTSDGQTLREWLLTSGRLPRQASLLRARLRRPFEGLRAGKPPSRKAAGALRGPQGGQSSFARGFGGRGALATLSGRADDADERKGALGAFGDQSLRALRFILLHGLSRRQQRTGGINHAAGIA
jgi:hypothetical protein